jgi:hypothetical protein
MRPLKSLALIAAIALYTPFALAADGSVTISSPADGAKLSRSATTTVTYDVTPGPKGDHVHLYVDNGEAAVLRQLKGSHEVGKLAPGSHEICVKEVTKAHAPTGVEKCIKVSVE